MKQPYDIIDIEIERLTEVDVITTSTLIPPDQDHDNGFEDFEGYE